MSLFHWSEETISHFEFISSYLSKQQTIDKIKQFVVVDCVPAEEETEEMLVEDLINIIYKQYEADKELNKGNSVSTR